MNHQVKKYNMSDKQKIKGMLCDAIRVLCQNTIFHNTKLSIEALVGITIDNGEDTLIISIQEHIGKQSPTAATSSTTEHNVFLANEFDQPEEFAEDGEFVEDGEEQGGDEYYDGQGADGVQMVGSDGASYDNVNQGQQFGVAVKQERITLEPYNSSRARGAGHIVKTENFYAEQNDGDDQFYGDESTYYEDDGTQYGGNASATQFVQTPKRRRPPPTNHRRSATKSPRVTPQKKRAAPATVTSGTEEPQSTTTEGGGIASRSRIIDNEVATVTLFTCSICGTQLRNRWSFVRHKQTHEGIFYRCEACGKMISRKDHLLAHKRKCQALQQRQEQLQELS